MRLDVPIEPLTLRAKAGETLTLRFVLIDLRKNEPVSDVGDVQLLAALASGQWSERYRAVPVGDGVYGAPLTLPLLLLGPLPAGATTVGDCQGLITTLRADTDAASFSGRYAAKDEQGLTQRLDAASDKLDRGKVADAIAKLNDYISKVNSLAAAGKLDAGDASDLLSGANGVITCINSIS